METLRLIPQLLVRTFAGLGGRGVSVAFFILLIIALFIVPLPPSVLDALLVINILMALTLLLRALFIEDPIQLFSFPTILLVTTLYRLALNVSSTRLILLGGDQGLDAAGRVIESFGSFVVQGDFVVGMIIFAVIATVNFVVIAKGSGRVAEVAARFILDSMPGKQLAIDADLRSGNITKEIARQQRAQLSRESQFYGSMDGAMKFVQGDAIAGLIITFINAIGGVSIGISRGMNFSDAVDTFGILTIGDGLVSILPSLLISVCAGVIVTHVSGSESSTKGSELLSQIVSEPRASVIAALALIVLGIVPGFPFLPFFLIGFLLLLWTASDMFKSGSRLFGSYGPQLLASGTGVRPVDHVALTDEEWRDRFLPSRTSSADHQEPLLIDGELTIIAVEVDAQVLATYLNTGAELLGGFKKFVEQTKEKIRKTRGVDLPEIHVRASADLAPGEYRILVRGEQLRNGTIDPRRRFVVAGPNLIRTLHLPHSPAVVHPIDRRACAWINDSPQGIECLSRLGVKVLEPYKFLVLEAVGSALQLIDEIFGLDEIQAQLVRLKSAHPSLYEEVFTREIISVPEFAEVVRRLLKERVNIRDLKLIVEGVAEFSASSDDETPRAEWLVSLHSFLRLRMSRSILADSLHASGTLRAFVLSPDLEDEFRSAVSMWDNNTRTRPPLDPDTDSALRESAKRMFQPVLDRGALPIVVLCSADIRVAVQEFLGDRVLSPDSMRTIAFEELSGFSTPESVGVLSVSGGA